MKKDNIAASNAGWRSRFLGNLNVLLAFVFLALSAGCQSSAYNAKVFHPWGVDDAADARAHWDSYTNIFMVCIYADHWEDRGPNKYSLHHETGTVVKVYKGDWQISEIISFVQGLDYPALKETNKGAGKLGFVFTNQHTNSELVLDTGEFSKYNPDYEPALDCLYPQKGR
jgi:hypothetical protein